METTKVHDKEILLKYKQELEEDTNITLMNLRDKALTMSSIRAKWLGYLFSEKENLAKIKDTRTKLLQQKVTEMGQNASILRVKNEDQIAGTDPRVMRLAELSKITSNNIDYIERAMTILNDLVWQVRNLVEILKLERL